MSLGPLFLDPSYPTLLSLGESKFISETVYWLRQTEANEAVAHLTVVTILRH